jgi:hypothetical protein
MKPEMEIFDDDLPLCDSEDTEGKEPWSAGNFGNSDAMNFLKKFLAGGSEDMLHQAILDIVNYPEDEYLDAQFCSEALVAAEMIAAAKGCPSLEEFPAEAHGWLEQNKIMVKKEVLASARAAVDRILHNSELKELWEEGFANDEWHLTIIDLRRRLG